MSYPQLGKIGDFKVEPAPQSQDLDPLDLKNSCEDARMSLIVLLQRLYKERCMPRTVRFSLFSAAVLIFGAGLMIAQESAPDPALKVIDAAVAKAKAENKAVFVHFSASW
jgi:hypothetical protein